MGSMKSNKGGKHPPITLNLTLVGTKPNTARKTDLEKASSDKYSNSEKNSFEYETDKNYTSTDHQPEFRIAEDISDVNNQNSKHDSKWVSNSVKTVQPNLRNIYEELCKRQDLERDITQQIHIMERNQLEERIARKEAWAEKKRQTHNDTLRKLQEFDWNMNAEDSRIEEEFNVKLEPLRQQLETLRNETAEAIQIASLSLKNENECFHYTQDSCNSTSCKKKKRRNLHNINIVQDFNKPSQVYTSEVENNLTDLFWKPILDTPKLASAKCCQEVRRDASGEDLVSQETSCETCTAFYRLEKLRKHIKGCGGYGCEENNVYYLAGTDTKSEINTPVNNQELEYRK